MRKFKSKELLLLFLLLFLSLHYSQSLEKGSQIKPNNEVLTFERGKNLEAQMPKATDEMLQFTAGGHVLGFRKGDAFIASGDHALRIKFLNARPVSPEDEGISPDIGNNRQGAKPLGRISYRDLWDGVSRMGREAHVRLLERPG